MGRVSKRKKYPVQDVLYVIVSGEREAFYNLCVYCGDPADTRDHVPPLSRVDDYRALGLKDEVYIKVSCCRECNGLGGNELQDSIIDRAEFIKGRLARKYLHRASLVEWDADELDELGPVLRSKVLAGSKRVKRAQERVNYYSGLDLVLAQLDPDRYGDWEDDPYSVRTDTNPG